MAMLPLEGIRVLDMGRFWAGPELGVTLGYLGAEVVKIESCSSPDPMRIFARGIYPNGEAGDEPWNRSGLVNERNRNKYGIALQIDHPKGREIFKRLVAKADALTENLSMEGARKLGLSERELQQANQTLVWVSLRSRGSTGPETERVSFGPTLSGLSGAVTVTGYENEMYQYVVPGISDVTAATLGSGLVIAGLYYRRRTGKGLHIDVSQLEAASSLVGEAFMDYFVTGNVPGPKGNRSRVAAPQGCYKCQGDDEWVTISVCSDEEWRNLCAAMGKPELADNPKFADLLSRHKNHDEIDKIIESVTAKLSSYEAMHKFQAAGVAAAPVANQAQISNDPHFAARNFFHTHLQPGVGSFKHRRPAMSFSGFELSVRLPAPKLGEHNHYILERWLGLTAKEIKTLEDEKVIGTRPEAWKA